jgi:hypothetical protein
MIGLRTLCLARSSIFVSESGVNHGVKIWFDPMFLGTGIEFREHLLCHFAVSLERSSSAE